VRLFREADDPIRELYSLVVVIECLAEMREWGEFDALLPRAAELVTALPADAPDTVPPALFAMRLRSAMERGEPETALAMLNALPPARSDHIYAIHHASWRESVRGAVLTQLGRLDEAADLLARTCEVVEPGTRRWYALLERQATCAALRADDEDLRDAASKALAAPIADMLKRLGSGRGLRISVSLAKALRDRGLDELACDALDRGAICAIERIREIDRVVRDLPELSFVTIDDRALLARVRKRFSTEHRELLRALATLFERAGTAEEPWFAGLLSGDHAVVCAWCARLRSDEGQWMPVGHLMPHDGPLRLSHGICETCLEQLYDRA